MLKNKKLKVSTIFFVAILLSVAIVSQPTSALLSQNELHWYWTSDTNSPAVAVGDLNGDGVNEIVTVGYYNNLFSWGAMMVVWNSITFAPINSMSWNWGVNTQVTSVAIGNITGGTSLDIITAGTYFDGTNDLAMLIVWNGATLAPERAMSWTWGVNTQVSSVAVGNVTGGTSLDIVTAGSYSTGTNNFGMLIVWNGATLAPTNSKSWTWGVDTYAYSVAVGNVTGGTSLDIVTTGTYSTGTNNFGMLIVWNGATLAPTNSKSWTWGVNTDSNSVAVGNITGGTSLDIVTAGSYSTGTNNLGMLIVWNGATLDPTRATSWINGLNTQTYSVAVGNITGGNTLDIVTGGAYSDGQRNYAQVIQWNSATLAMASTATWYTVSDTTAYCVTIGNIGTGNRIVESGQFWDNLRSNAQLTIWG